MITLPAGFGHAHHDIYEAVVIRRHEIVDLLDPNGLRANRGTQTHMEFGRRALAKRSILWSIAG